MFLRVASASKSDEVGANANTLTDGHTGERLLCDRRWDKLSKKENELPGHKSSQAVPWTPYTVAHSIHSGKAFLEH